MPAQPPLANSRAARSAISPVSAAPEHGISRVTDPPQAHLDFSVIGFSPEFNAE
jgi:hypothetical protein